MRNSRLIEIAAFLIVVMLSTSGCFFNVFQTAEPIPPGTFMLTGGASALEYIGILYMTQQLHARYGISEGLDIGARIGSYLPVSNGSLELMGVVTDIKYQLLKQPSVALGIGLGAVVPMGGLFPDFVLEASAYGSFNVGFLAPYIAFRSGWNISDMKIENQLALGTAVEMGDVIDLWLEASLVRSTWAIGGAVSITFGK